MMMAQGAKQKTHHLVRFKTGSLYRYAKSSKKSKISNAFRQLIYQPASHLASQFYTIYSCVSWFLEKANMARRLILLIFC